MMVLWNMALEELSEIYMGLSASRALGIFKGASQSLMTVGMAESWCDRLKKRRSLLDCWVTCSCCDRCTMSVL